jgi:NADPH-dependent curcumin reductase CurA
VSRAVVLAARPKGEPRPEDFELVEVEVPEPAVGQALVRNTWMSVDPAMRPRMDDVPSYAPPYELGEPMEGAALGRVIDSHIDGLDVGDVVVHWHGWRDHALLDGRAARGIRRVDLGVAPPEAHLSVLGHTGFAAYVGLFEIAKVRPSEVVFVSGAAGAVGSLAGQMAKLRGCRAIGSAGGSAKVAHLADELGFDAAIDYREGSLAEALSATAPGGIDVYFDNVGGRHLEAAIHAMRDHGRIAICGTISTYNETGEPEGIRNQFQIVAKRLTLRGFLMRDHLDLMEAFLAEVGAWVAEGRLRYSTTVVDGLDHAPDALISMMRGGNTGKMLVRIEED